MDGRTSESFRRDASKRGFTLIEILVVVVIMGALVGVVGSIFVGYMDFYWATKDQSAASRKAQDVFNALEPIVLNAGLGMPGTNPGAAFDSSAPPVVGWTSPLIVAANTLHGGTGNILKVLYSVRSGFKNGPSEVVAFAAREDAPTSDVVSGDVTLIGSQADRLPGAPDHMPVSGFSGNNMASYVTFPGAYMRPLRITAYNAAGSRLSLSGRRPAYDASADAALPFAKNLIHPFHDMYLVRAAVAYVDGNSVFRLVNLTTADFGAAGFNPDNLSGFRINGIKALRFTKNGNTSITVSVLAEGDVVDSQRVDDTTTLVARWLGVTFERSKHYEEFTKTWRTRNIE